MTIKTTVIIFQISNRFKEWAKIFDNPEIDVFQKLLDYLLFIEENVQHIQKGYCNSSCLRRSR